jgi:hypothetical protein
LFNMRARSTSVVVRIKFGFSRRALSTNTYDSRKVWSVCIENFEHKFFVFRSESFVRRNMAILMIKIITTKRDNNKIWSKLSEVPNRFSFCLNSMVIIILHSKGTHLPWLRSICILCKSYSRNSLNTNFSFEFSAHLSWNTHITILIFP